MAYLEEMLIEARRMAAGHDREFLVYLIEMAILECRTDEPKDRRKRQVAASSCSAG